MPAQPLQPGDPAELGGYRLLGRLGAGGMGAVYLGRGRDGRPVAVKVIRPDLASEAEFRGRFRSEVNRARAVPSFCTAPVLDADPDHATPYLVVEYVDGPDLAEVIDDRGPLSGGELDSVAIGVATALAAIHGAGVIHRDLKPRNVLFALGSPKVIDFGIARPFEATSNHTGTDQMVGTVSYMAPERFDTDGPGTGPAADVFAWGVLITYAGTGRTPFAADSPAATAARILTQPPELGRLPAPLRGIVARTLAKNPADRPTAAQLLELLLDTGSHRTAELTGGTDLRRAAQAARAGAAPRRRRGRGLTVAAAALVALAAAGAWALKDRHPAAAPVPEAGPSPSATPAGRLLIGDRLDQPGRWSAATDELGTCAFADGRMVVTARGSGANSCPGPADRIAGDQSIAVTVALLGAHSCGWIGFRRVSDDLGYNLFLCAGHVTLSRDADDNRSTLSTVRSPVLAGGGDHRVELRLRGGVATVEVDGLPVGRAPVTDRRLRTGHVELGLETDDQSPDGTVAFRDAEIRRL
ncbi:serine/threonine-protein kinase [Actinoplanes sp. RD1]|uniref:serine/threonine-protein kinase n=1 Tax=Actinoplanes sp. RD1 TaxID=3064538 RepID=UPI0027427871|nr:serine/threonine-protein kinase [Actinoplanes sp. RD1]